MAAAIAVLNLSSPRVSAKAADTPKSGQTKKLPWLGQPWKRSTQFGGGRCMYVIPVAAAPDKISEKVADSIKGAEEACASDPVSGKCAAAWDEVEELSAAASHARDRKKESDPLEAYCKDNPETDECRTYED